MGRFSPDTCSSRKASPEALQKLADVLKEINDKIHEAEAIAKEYGLTFSADFGYGGGASYGLHSVRSAKENSIDYNPKEITKDEWDEDAVYYWYTSTMSCM